MEETLVSLFELKKTVPTVDFTTKKKSTLISFTYSCKAIYSPNSKTLWLMCLQDN